jgi:hypothetical protein
MIIGVVVVALGFTIMTMDKEPHGFGFLGITLSPVVVLIGFGIGIYAILYTPRQKS